MVDPESVRRRLRELDRRLLELRTIEAGGRDAFLGSTGLQAQAERHLHLAIQCAIDVAVHILAEDAGGTPEDYGSAFALTVDVGLMDAELAQRLRPAAGLRNILVHGYLDVDPARIWSHLSHLEDLTAFATRVEDYLARNA